MKGSEDEIRIYVERGQKRCLAVPLDWPGWCRSGKDEGSALESLLRAAPRYGEILRREGLTFDEPNSLNDFQVCERVEGGAASDMGVPSVVLTRDAEPMDSRDVEAATSVLRACWGGFDRAVDAAMGRELRKGPRGGGRELEGMMRHVIEAEAGYADRVGLKVKWEDLAEMEELRQALAFSHERVLEGLTAVAAIGTPPPGPRGGARWPGRYFVRRVAYHVIDHTWEIEDRLDSAG